jgi:hypothetical protein
MRESRSYGSVGEQGGNELLYPEEKKKCPEWRMKGEVKN